MAEHTPGPWKVRKSIHGERYAVVQIGADENYTTLELEPADANLIAAAPDLLTELEAAHRLLSLALGCMTTAGQAKFARQSEIAGLGADGASRHHERAAVLAKATGAAL